MAARGLSWWRRSSASRRPGPSRHRRQAALVQAGQCPGFRRRGLKHFDAAWKASRRCIVPMSAFFVDDWRSGKAVPTRIARVDGRPMGVAGLWESCTGPDGECVTGFALLTVDASGHGLMHRYMPNPARTGMPVILNGARTTPGCRPRWPKAREFMRLPRQLADRQSGRAGLKPPGRNRFKIRPWSTPENRFRLRHLLPLVRDRPGRAAAGARAPAAGRCRSACACSPSSSRPNCRPAASLAEMLTTRYGSTPEQQTQMYATLRQRGAEVGFEFAPEAASASRRSRRTGCCLGRRRAPERQLALKQALLLACHRDRLPMDADDVLLAAAGRPDSTASARSGYWTATIRRRGARARGPSTCRPA